MTAFNENLVDIIRDALRSVESRENLPILLEDLQPFDLASILPEFEKQEQLSLMSVLPAGKVADMLEYLEPVQQYWNIKDLVIPVLVCWAVPQKPIRWMRWIISIWPDLITLILPLMRSI